MASQEMMMTITLRVPRATPLAALRDMADSIGCDLRLMPDGSYMTRPRDVQTNRLKQEAQRKRPREAGEGLARAEIS